MPSLSTIDSVGPNSNISVSIGGLITVTSATTVDFGAVTSNMVLPKGSTAQRPTGSTSTGAIRYNTDTNATEVYTSSTWARISTVSSDQYISNVALLMTGGTLIDYTGRHNFANVNVGSPVTTPGKPFVAAPETAWYLINSGTNNYIDVQNNLADFGPMAYTNWTIEFWMYKTGTGNGYGHFFNIGGQSANGVIKFSIDTSYGLYWYSANGELINFGGVSSYSANTWAHFVFEKYGTTMTTWRNGTRIAQNTNTLPSGTPAYLRLGGPFNAEYGPHYFDELRVTTAARYQGAASIPVQTAAWPRP